MAHAKVAIIPSILVQTEKEFLEQSRAVSDVLSMIQLDIADGKFVPNTTWAEPDVVSEKLEIDCELHLMVQNPLAEARKWAEVPQVKRVLFHYEAAPDTAGDVAAQIRSYGWEVSVVLNPDTPLSVLDPLLEEIDGVMFMGVNPGFQGQKLIPEVLENIQKFKAKKTSHFVEIDGGVNEDALMDIIASGVDAICPGSAIFVNDRTPRENVKRMKKIIEMRKKL
ncbi:MAG: ribulose-phosphate 3-epimerase [Patescibacteria group bacterium]